MTELFGSMIAALFASVLAALFGSILVAMTTVVVPAMAAQDERMRGTIESADQTA